MTKFYELGARFVERHKVLGASPLIVEVEKMNELRDWYTDLLEALEQDKSVKGKPRQEWRRKLKLELRKIESFFIALEQETAQAKAETIH